MRVLIDVDDACMDTILSTKGEDGRFILVTLEAQACLAKIVGRAIPESIAGNGHTYKAMYTIIMLEEMDGSWTDHDSASDPPKPPTGK